MTKTISYCALICSATLVVVLSLANPPLLSDSHAFLRHFMGHELLAVLGVVLAITLGSAAQLHLSLNNIEERAGQENLFIKTRAGIKSSVYALLALFWVAILLIVAKPVIATTETLQSIFNGLSLVLLLWNTLILASISEAVFGIKPLVDGSNHSRPN